MKIIESTIITKEEQVERQKESAINASNKFMQDLSKNLKQINDKLSSIENKLSTKQINAVDSEGEHNG